ncbi:hypothetical protein DF147_09705 [Burkholderia cenocepacia]|nr:hypothetical protein DF147_09705 [Burkholderia cenocepacia]
MAGKSVLHLSWPRNNHWKNETVNHAQALNKLRIFLSSAAIVPDERHHVLIACIRAVRSIKGCILRQFANEIPEAMTRSKELGFDDQLE